MPSFVVKVAPDTDEYVVWSTVTDSPHAWGTRDEIAEWLATETVPDTSPAIVHRLQRADATGTSALHGWGAWDDDGFIFAQRGFLPRARLAEFLASFDPDAETFDESLLEPLEDGAQP